MKEGKHEVKGGGGGWKWGIEESRGWRQVRGPEEVTVQGQAQEKGKVPCGCSAHGRGEV